MTTGQEAALGIALLIGLLLGAMGSGGSIVALPVLVYIAGIPPKAAVPMSMVIVGASSFVAAILHARQKRFHPKAASLLGATGIAGAYLGSGATHMVAATTLMLIFAAVVLIVGILILTGAVDHLSASACRPVRCLSVGAAVGVLTGFLGVGGGFLIVPALIFFAGLETKVAVGTSLAIIALNSTAGLLGQIRYAQFDWTLTLSFTGLTLIGMVWGTRLADRIPEETFRKVFAAMLVIIGLIIGGLNLSAS